MYTFGGIKDSANVTFYDPATGKPVLYYPYANSFQLNVSSETAEAMARGVSKIKWSHSKSGSLTLTAQVIPIKLLGMILGSVDTKETAKVSRVEVKTVTSTKITLTDAPNAGTMSVFLCGDDNKTLLEEITVGTPTSNPLEYSVSSKDITFNTTQNGKKVIVFYVIDKADTSVMKVKGTVFGKPVKIVATSTIRLENGVDKPVQITLPVATPQATADINFQSDTPSDFSFSYDLSADANDDMIIIEDI